MSARRRYLHAVTALLLVLAGCAPATANEVPEIEIVADGSGTSGYSFDLPERLPPGPTRLSLTNDGDEPHHAQLFALKHSATADDLAAAFATGDPQELAEYGTLAGGTGLVDPGGTSRADAVIDLTEGRYAVVCVVEDSEGVPHLAHGMVREFEVREVAGDGGSARAQAPADASVELLDYGFQAPDSVASGAVLEVTNTAAAEPHEMLVARLDEGASARDVSEAMAAGAPVPATFVGGVQGIAPGDSQRLQLDLEPGAYVLLCAIPSAGGTPHYAKGMIRELDVE